MKRLIQVMINFIWVRRFFLFIPFLIFNATLIHAQFNKPNATAYNYFDDHYYVTNYSGQSVVKLNRNGNKSVFIQNLTAPNNIIFDVFPFGPAFIILDSNRAKVFDTTGSMIANILVPNAVKLMDLVYDSAAQCIYTSDVENGWIIKTTFGSAPNYTPNITVWISGLVRPSNLLLQKNNNRLLFVQDTMNSNLMTVDLNSKSVTVLRNTGLSLLSGLAQDAEGNYYISSQFEKNIYQWNKYLTGSPKRIVGEPKPGDITVNSAKDEWVYCCILCGSVYVAKLHTFGPAMEIMGCPGDSVDIYKNTLIKCLGTFHPGNQFVLELSTPLGNFDTAITLATVTDTLQPVYQRIRLPENLIGSKKYRYRYRTTNPAVIGSFELLYLNGKPQEQFTKDSMAFCGLEEEYLIPKDTQFVYQYWSTPIGFKDSSKTIYAVSRQPETIYLRTKNADGCLSYDTVVTYPILTSQIQLSVKSDSIVYCTSLPPNAHHLIWKCNDTMLTDTTSEIVVRKTGYYTLNFIVSATNDCNYVTDSMYVEHIPNVNSNAILGEEINLEIYPIPSQEQLNIRSNTLLREIQIYDALGSQLTQIKVDNFEAVFNIPEFRDGVFVIRITTANGLSFSRRLIKISK